jgi:hypothetical protein
MMSNGGDSHERFQWPSGRRDFELEWEIAARTCGMGSGEADVTAQMRALRDKGILGGTDSGHLERPRASNLGLGDGMPAA